MANISKTKKQQMNPKEIFPEVVVEDKVGITIRLDEMCMITAKLIRTMLK